MAVLVQSSKGITPPGPSSHSICLQYPVPLSRQSQIDSACLLASTGPLVASLVGPLAGAGTLRREDMVDYHGPVYKFYQIIKETEHLIELA